MEITKTYTKDDKIKAKFIGTLSQKNCELLIFFDESPEDFLEAEINSKQIHIEKIKGNAYKIIPPYTYDILGKWLYYGNWIAIWPAVENFPGINTFSAEVDEVKTLMQKNNIKVIIDSFHDNIEWNIFDTQ